MRSLRHHTASLLAVFFALLIALLFFLLIFQSMPQYLDYDQVWYLENINASLSPYGFLLFNPHHLHFEIGGKIFQQFMADNFGVFGFTDVTFNMRLRSLLAASAALVFLFLFLKNLTGRLVWAVAGTLLLAVTHGFLMYAGKVDTGIFPVLGVCMILWLARQADKPDGLKLGHSLLLGLFFFANLLFHQFMAICCVLTVFVFALPETVFQAALPLQPFSLDTRRPLRAQAYPWRVTRRFVNLVVAAVCGVILIGATYFYVGRLYYNLPFAGESPAPVGRFPFEKFTFQKWLFFYQADDRPWGRGINTNDVQIPYYSFTKGMLSATGPKYLRAIERDAAWRIKFDYNVEDIFAPKNFVFNLAAFFSLITVAGCIFFFPALLARFRRIFLLCLLSFVTFSLFAVFWEAAYVEFWLVPVALFLVLGIMVLKIIEEKLALFLSRTAAVVVLPFLVALVIGFFAHNMLYSVIPYCLQPHVEDVLAWPEYNEKYQQYFSRGIYKNPVNPYAQIWPVGDLRLPYSETKPEKEFEADEKEETDLDARDSRTDGDHRLEAAVTIGVEKE